MSHQGDINILEKIALKSTSMRVRMETPLSAVRGFKSKFEEELKKAKRQSRPITKPLPEKKRGRPLIFGPIDLQAYLKLSYLKIYSLLSLLRYHMS